MDDSVSRQMAIDAVEHIISSMSVCVNTDECHGMKRMQRLAVIELANMPSTQRENIRCQDCKHWINGHLCESLSRFGSFETKADFYCGFAERKTDGKAD